MSAAGDFARALADADGDDDALLPDRLSQACTVMLGVDAAGLSFGASAERRLPLGSSDEAAARAERLQFALGEGPCFTAQRTRTAVRADQATMRDLWPVYAQELALLTPFRSVVAHPVGGLWSSLAALDLYSTLDSFPPVAETDVQTAADLVGDALTAHSSGRGAPLGLPRWMQSPPAERRQQVWLAIGRLIAQRGTDAADSLALLRGHAFRNGRDLEWAARAILRGELPPA